MQSKIWTLVSLVLTYTKNIKKIIKHLYLYYKNKLNSIILIVIIKYYNFNFGGGRERSFNFLTLNISQTIVNLN